MCIRDRVIGAANGLIEVICICISQWPQIVFGLLFSTISYYLALIKLIILWYMTGFITCYFVNSLCSVIHFHCCFTPILAFFHYMVQFHSSMKIDGLSKTLLPVSTGAMHLQAHISFCYFLTHSFHIVISKFALFLFFIDRYVFFLTLARPTWIIYFWYHHWNSNHVAFYLNANLLWSFALNHLISFSK